MLGIFSSPITTQFKPSNLLNKKSINLDQEWIKRAVYFLGKNNKGRPAKAIIAVIVKKIVTDIYNKILFIIIPHIIKYLIRTKLNLKNSFKKLIKLLLLVLTGHDVILI